MQHKIIGLLLVTALAVTGCMEMGAPYGSGALNQITVQAVWPDGEAPRAGARVSIEDVTGGTTYSLETDAAGQAQTRLPNGIFRITLRDTRGTDIFNATRDRVVISNQDVSLSLELKRSKAGALVIKELYCGGCSKAPKEGNYQSDQYLLLHNNSAETTWLDGLCLGTLSPYNSIGSNPWISDGALPDFLPVIQAVLMIPGSGKNFPLAPGEDAVVCLRGAIDHTQEYPLSVNLNLPEAFVCYDPVLFPNTTYHPAPGNLVSRDRYLVIVVKTGQANAYTLSLNSPAFILFRAPEGTDIQTYANDNANQPQIPGSNERVVAIPPEWVIDGLEVFFGGSSNNQKRMPETVDAGAATLSETFKGHTLMRKVDENATAEQGYEVLQDTNNSTEDFYERETQSLHED